MRRLVTSVRGIVSTYPPKVNEGHVWHYSAAMTEVRAGSDGVARYKMNIRCGVALADGSPCGKGTSRERIGDGPVQAFCPDHGLVATISRNLVDAAEAPTQAEVAIRCGASLPDGSRCGKNPDPRTRTDGRVRLVCPDHGVVAVVGKRTVLPANGPA